MAHQGVRESIAGAQSIFAAHQIWGTLFVSQYNEGEEDNA
jgi:hypothetical protein